LGSEKGVVVLISSSHFHSSDTIKHFPRPPSFLPSFSHSRPEIPQKISDESIRKKKASRLQNYYGLAVFSKKKKINK
jgi:hypothetical protein